MQVAIVSADSDAGQLAAGLRSAGIQSQTCGSLADVARLVQLFGLDLVLIDTGSAGAPEQEIRAFRAVHHAVPVVVFGQRCDVDFTLTCFSAGADDVVAWPGDLDLIVARIKVIVRRCRGAETTSLRIGPLSVDMIGRSLQVDGQPLVLTSKEYDVLEYMITRKNRVLSKDALLNQLYGGKDAPDSRIINVFVCKLRKKLAGFGVHDLIETVRGFGYRLNERSCRFARTKACCPALPAAAAAAAA